MGDTLPPFAIIMHETYLFSQKKREKEVFRSRQWPSNKADNFLDSKLALQRVKCIQLAENPRVSTYIGHSR